MHDAAFAQGYATARRPALPDRHHAPLRARARSPRCSARRRSRAIKTRASSTCAASSIASTRACRRAIATCCRRMPTASTPRPTHESLPPEYRALLLRFAPWRPQDSLAVGFAIGARPRPIRGRRDRARYGRARRRPARARRVVLADRSGVRRADRRRAAARACRRCRRSPARARRRPLRGTARTCTTRSAATSGRPARRRTATGRALLANDPHLGRRIPGDLAPRRHQRAGAARRGRGARRRAGRRSSVTTSAWRGARRTADAVSARVFAETFTSSDGLRYRAGAQQRDATRARRDVQRPLRRAAQTRATSRRATASWSKIPGLVRHAVQWDRRSTLAFAARRRFSRSTVPLRSKTVCARSPTYPGARRRTSRWRRPTVASPTRSPARFPTIRPGGVRSPTARAPAQPLTFVPFARLPHVAPGRAALAINANNLAYGAGYPVPPRRVLQRAVSRGRDRAAAARAADGRRRRIARDSSRHDLARRSRTRAAVRRGAAQERRDDRDPDTRAGRSPRSHAFDGRFDPGVARRDRHPARPFRRDARPDRRAPERRDRGRRTCATVRRS